MSIRPADQEYGAAAGQYYSDPSLRPPVLQGAEARIVVPKIRDACGDRPAGLALETRWQRMRLGGTIRSGSRHSNAPGVLVAPRQVRRRRRPIANLDHRHRERPDPHLERAGWDRTLHPAKDNCLGELQ